MIRLAKATSKRWLLRSVLVVVACAVLLVSCSEQQRQRVMMALIDGYPQDEGTAGDAEQAKSETAEAEDGRIAAAPTGEDESAGSFKGVSANHADFATDCDACHGPDKLVTDDRCGECHDVGLHQDAEMDATCGSCHLEHRGLGADLTQVGVERCTECHDQHPFEEEHPEFVLVADAEAARKAKYAAGLEVFHSLHAEDSECSECHRPTSGGAPAFKPVTFAEACATCHELDEHQMVPETGWAELRTKLPAGDLADVVLLADARWRQRVEALKDQPELAAVEEVREALADDGLEECFRCHSFIEKGAEGAATLAVAPVRYRSRWFGSARFNHGVHSDMDCADCHAVPKDEDTELGRLMLPPKDTCAECHNADAASATCATCHLFHYR